MRFLKAIVRQMAEAFLMGLLATKMLLVSCKNLFANLFANLKLDVVQALDSMALDSMALDSESNAFGSFESNAESNAFGSFGSNAESKTFGSNESKTFGSNESKTFGSFESNAESNAGSNAESKTFGSNAESKTFGSNESNPLSKKSLHDAKRWLNALKFLFPNVKCLRHAAQAVYTWLVSREDKKIQACLYLYSPDGDTTSSDFFMHALEDYI